MDVYHVRSERRMRVPRAYRLFARERETITEAFPGDVIGVVNPGAAAIEFLAARPAGVVTGVPLPIVVTQRAT